MREIKYIVLHCTATPQTATIDAIKNYWTQHLKWKSVGYHYVIKPSGEVVNLAKIELATNGVAGFNKNAIHISYIGGVNEEGKAVDNRTKAQLESMKNLVVLLSTKFPKAEIRGHRDFPNVIKECPSFCVSDWVKKEKIK